MSLKITVQSGKGDKVKNNEISLVRGKEATVHDLKREFAKNSKRSIYRLSFKKNEIKLDNDSQTLVSYGVIDGDILVFKDLGPQIGYRTVFVLEYFGPMLFVGLYYLRPSFIYASGVDKPYNWVALLGVSCWMVHFLKRELETFFVHKFSRPTMPLSNLFKNCIYYWSFGAVIGYPLCSPTFLPPQEVLVYTGLTIFVLSEIGNLICHLMLSNMRPSEGSQDRQIPKGFLFELVACPNYTFEILSWIGFSVMTQLPFAYLFTAVGFYQMAEWAVKKHNGYKKAFDKDYIKLRRKAIIPFVY
eukprot:gene6533-8975_t